MVERSPTQRPAGLKMQMEKTVNKLALAFGTLAILATPAVAAEDPVMVRKILMQGNAAGAGLAGAMLKGEMEYSPAAGKAAIASMNAASHAFGDYFSEGSAEEDTTAAPAIWEDAAGWEAELAKFTSATSAAAEASGREGPADLDTFKAAVGPVLGTCKSCHEGYRVKR